MGRRAKSIEERCVRVNISIPAETLNKLDENVERVKSWLCSRCSDKKGIDLLVSRSALIRELVETAASETGYHALLTGFCAVLGIDDKQTELKL